MRSHWIHIDFKSCAYRERLFTIELSFTHFARLILCISLESARGDWGGWYKVQACETRFQGSRPTSRKQMENFVSKHTFSISIFATCQVCKLTAFPHYVNTNVIQSTLRFLQSIFTVTNSMYINVISKGWMAEKKNIPLIY